MPGRPTLPAARAALVDFAAVLRELGVERQKQREFQRLNKLLLLDNIALRKSVDQYTSRFLLLERQV